MPIFEYLCRCIKSDISEGKLKSGDKLPSKRRMAESYGISVTSVQSAYEQLISEGYVEGIEKKGYFIADIPQVSPLHTKKEIKIVSIENPDNEEKLQNVGTSFPYSVWSRLMRSVISERGDRLHGRMPAGGVYELRRAISGYLSRSAGIEVSPERIIVGAGTEYLCSLVVTLLGRERLYAFENPGYKKIAGIAASSGASIVPVETDKEGIVPEMLKKSGASFLHVSPSNHFPTGNVMPAKRRYSLLSWLGESEDRYIIEDDYESEIYLTGRRMPTLFEIDTTGRVIYMNTFTKTISPSFRVGFIILPESLCEKLRNEYPFLSCTVTSFEQYTLAKFIEDGHFESKLSKERTRYRTKIKALIDNLSRFEDFDTLYSGVGTNISIILKKSVENDLLNSLTSDYPWLYPLSGCSFTQEKYCRSLILDTSALTNYMWDTIPEIIGKIAQMAINGGIS